MRFLIKCEKYIKRARVGWWVAVQVGGGGGLVTDGGRRIVQLGEGSGGGGVCGLWVDCQWERVGGLPVGEGGG